MLFDQDSNLTCLPVVEGLRLSPSSTIDFTYFIIHLQAVLPFDNQTIHKELVLSLVTLSQLYNPKLNCQCRGGLQILSLHFTASTSFIIVGLENKFF
jgi:hypothetical protein